MKPGGTRPYAQLDYNFTPRWRLISGLRFETFEDDYNDSNALISKTDDQYFTGELTLQHDWKNGSFLYATLSRGVKPGGVNTEASSVFDFMDPNFVYLCKTVCNLAARAC